nr:hypothetical protein L203_04238 [Cryptococcus depauperatus CBS 7841]
MLRLYRLNMKLFLNLSITINFILLIYFIGHEQVHGIVGDNVLTKLQQSYPYSVLARQNQSYMTVQPRGCSMCEMDAELCRELGKERLERSLAYSGSNRRLRRALAKLRRGQTINIGAVGGSVTKGFGLDQEKEPYWPDTPTNFHRIVFDHLVSLYPAPNGVKTGESGKEEDKHGYINGGLGGLGTDYFSLCWREHVPDDLDIVFVEQAINDEVLLRNINSYELLVRSLLDLPNKPAVVNFHVFALMFNTVTNGGDLHQGIAQFYDLPILSLRNAVLNDIYRNESMIRDFFFVNSKGAVDTRHISRYSHSLLGRIGSAYMDSQLCEMDRYEASLSEPNSMTIDELYPVEPIPRMQLHMKYDSDTVLPMIKPQCFSADGKKHPLAPIDNKGWRKWNWKGKNYLIADQPGSRVSFSLTSRLGGIEIHYLRSYQYHLGSASCWVDHDKAKAVRLDGYWREPFNLGRAAIIRDDLEPGEHTLTCELLNHTADPEGGKEFRLIAVMRSVCFTHVS